MQELIESIDQGFRVVNRGAKRSHRSMLRILNTASLSHPFTLSRYAPAHAVRQAWPKGGARGGGRQPRGGRWLRRHSLGQIRLRIRHLMPLIKSIHLIKWAKIAF